MGIALKLGIGIRGSESVKFIPLVIFFLFSISITESLAPPAMAQLPYSRIDSLMSTDLAPKLNQKISLDLRDINVLDVLKFLSTKADVNIVTSGNITGRVTLFLKDVSIGTALDIILLSTGLAFREQGNILYVMTGEEYAALYGEPYHDQREIKIVQMKYTDAAKVGEIVGGIKSSIGKIVIDKQTGTLVLIDTPEKIRLMEEAASKIDIPSVERILPTQSAVFEINYNKAADLQAQVQSLLTPGVGSAKVDEKTNQLFITDFDPAIKKIETLVKAFDRKTRQVHIETKLFQVRLSNEYQMGIDWQRTKGDIQPRFNFPAPDVATSFGRLVVGDLGRRDAQATINFLHSFGETKTLASPQLTVEHNEEASILVGTREAYVTSTVSQASSTTTTSEAITFIDVGVKLKVQPQINKKGFVSMKVTPEVSAVGRTLVTANSNEIPIVDTTNASTKVTVKDGHTVLIGGLMKDEVVKAVNKFPILGDLPWIGSAFRSTDDTVVKTELVLFLTPHIVQGDEPLPFSPAASGKKFDGPRDFDE
jgi:type II secretory pathway component GspD/PulD (secretin)